jgi:hypothetical protein
VVEDEEVERSAAPPALAVLGTRLQRMERVAELLQEEGVDMSAVRRAIGEARAKLRAPLATGAPQGVDRLQLLVERSALELVSRTVEETRGQLALRPPGDVSTSAALRAIDRSREALRTGDLASMVRLALRARELARTDVVA